MKSDKSISRNVFSKEVSKEDVYKAYFTVINGILKLTPKEIDIVSRLYYYNNEIAKNVKDIKLQGVLLFSSEYKKKIATELAIDNLLLNNYISTLKKKSIILVDKKTDGKWMNPRFTISIDKDIIQLIFNFNVVENNEKQEESGD